MNQTGKRQDSEGGKLEQKGNSTVSAEAWHREQDQRAPNLGYMQAIAEQKGHGAAKRP